MAVLEKFLNPMYLKPEYISLLQETIKSKPISKYLVLDNFLKEDILDQIIADHQLLDFSEKADRTAASGEWLPYDGALAGCRPDSLIGELLYSKEWQDYCLKIVGLPYDKKRRTEIKLRTHKEEATGFWLHSDAGGGGGGARDLVSILYFNKNWTYEDGGLLQLWKVDEADYEGTTKINYTDALKGRLDFLNTKRLNARPAGIWPYDKQKDLILVEQIVPAYNRIFICNFKDEPAYHSVTPSNGKVRQGFVQWLLEEN